MASSNITRHLEGMSHLLEAANEQGWAASLRRLQLQIETSATSPSDYQRALRDVLKLFGGMGSFSDLVLYRDGVPLQAENDRLSQLRSMLFEAARNDLK